MKKEAMKTLCISVLEKLKNIEASEKELGQEFIQLGLQLSGVESCERITNVAKQYAYLLSNCYQPEGCEWSELADDINELRVDLYKANASLEVDIFFDAKTHFDAGINNLKLTIESAQCENMTITEAIEFAKYFSQYIEMLRSRQENCE